MGYKVKLDTNGSNPEMIESLIKEKLVDYIAMDIKAPADKYPKITNVRTDMKQIKTSIKLIMEAAPKYEFRTTIVRSQLSFNDVLEIGKSIKDAELYVLQKFVPSKILDKTLMKEKTYEDDELEELRQKLEGYVKKCLVR
jgi:Pyruvate-formate lyase-activating enzyme